MRALLELLARSEDAARGGLRARLGWIEQAADAAERAGLGEVGSEAALELRAALGAIIAYARSGQDPRQLAELEAAVGAFTRSALVRLCGGLSDSFATLAAEAQRSDAEDCRELARLFSELGGALTAGEPPPPSILSRLAWLAPRAAP